MNLLYVYIFTYSINRIRVFADYIYVKSSQWSIAPGHQQQEAPSIFILQDYLTCSFSAHVIKGRTTIFCAWGFARWRHMMGFRIFSLHPIYLNFNELQSLMLLYGPRTRKRSVNNSWISMWRNIKDYILKSR